MDCRKAATGLV